MRLVTIQKLNIKTSLLIVTLFNAVFLIYACTKSTEVLPGPAGCFIATMHFPAPEPVTSASCDTGNFAFFKFVRTDVPDFAPLLKNAPPGGAPFPVGGKLTCSKTIILSSSEVTNRGFGRWQVTHSFAPNWDVTCPEVEISQCPTLFNNSPVPVSHTTMGIDDCIQEKVVQGEGDIVPFPE